MGDRVDAIVVGGGPNGLAAAIVLARAGRSVRLVEAADTLGGGCRSAELTLPGVVHDVCSAVHPMARASPVFAGLGLERHGLEWIEPPVQVAHPLDDGPPALLHREIDATVASFGNAQDAARYRGWIEPLVAEWDLVVDALIGPLRPAKVARHPLRLARFAIPALASVTMLARRFRSRQARALVAGVGAHSFLPLGRPTCRRPGPGAAGGRPRRWLAAPAGRLAADHRCARGSAPRARRRDRHRTSRPRHSRARTNIEWPSSTCRRAASSRWPAPPAIRATPRSCERYRYGPAAFKLDLVLDGPIPWRDAAVGRAATVHLGGRLEEIEASEDAVAAGRVHERPFVLLVQPSSFDSSRAPEGRHVAWAYCHVPNGWTGDATARILGQVERFAPGFRDRIVAQHVIRPSDLEAYNPNYVGGDINGGLQHWAQFFTRPALRLDPYATSGSRHLHRLVVDARRVVACTGCAGTSRRNRRCDEAARLASVFEAIHVVGTGRAGGTVAARLRERGLRVTDGREPDPDGRARAPRRP